MRTCGLLMICTIKACGEKHNRNPEDMPPWIKADDLSHVNEFVTTTKGLLAQMTCWLTGVRKVNGIKAKKLG